MADGVKIKGGKGSSRDSGTHVPLIASFPGACKGGRVSKDLIDSTDFLPTVCEAAGVPVPAELKIDGLSFLPQVRGETGQPREWVYSWFSQHGGPSASKEFARNQRYKLYTDGSFFDMVADPLEQNALVAGSLNSEARSARQLLQSALDQYKNARPSKIAAQAGKGREE
jgi:arylsulfatase A